MQFVITSVHWVKKIACRIFFCQFRETTRLLILYFVVCKLSYEP